MKGKKHQIAIVLYSVLFVIVIPLVLNLLYKFNSHVMIFQTEWQAEDALVFYGEILSAAVTVIGVAWTINHERKARIRDNSVLYKPILELVQVDPSSLPALCGYRDIYINYVVYFSNSVDHEQGCEIFFTRQKQNNPKFILLIQNVGRGETFNAVVDDHVIKETNWDDISCLSANGGTQFIGEIIQNGYLCININLPDYLILPRHLEDKEWLEFTTELSLSYSDMFNRIRYQSALLTRYKISIIEEEQQIVPYIENDSYHYVKVRYEIHEIMPIKRIFSKDKNSILDEHEFMPDSDE